MPLPQTPERLMRESDHRFASLRSAVRALAKDGTKETVITDRAHVIWEHLGEDGLVLYAP